jgi:tetratricopeptide (TPR) repeat protein
MAPVATDRIVRLEHWLKAVDQHTPGAEDDALVEVGAWSTSELRTLWLDVKALALLMRNLRLRTFQVQTDGQRGPTEVRYTSFQLRRLTVLACAAAGIVADRDCLAIKAETDLDADLLRLSKHAGATRAGGDDNYILRRGALLHSDVAMLKPTAPIEPVTAASLGGPERVRIEMSDGLQTELHQGAIHWEIAEMVLDQVKPPGFDKPAPGRDEMVRQWYRSTAAWMQFYESHDTLHLDRARRIFPADPDILFLSGTQHEAYASPAIQSVARSAVLPTGFALDLGSDRAELRRAESFFRQALAQKTEIGEAHLRLGRVLGLLGHHAEAADELRHALTGLDDDQLRYYGALFLGAEEEALGRFDAAREAYLRAAALYPGAQSPHLAVSQLARRTGDRAGALRAIQQVFELSRAGPARDDPWWTYHTAQARNADALVDALRLPFITVEPQ